MQRLRFVVIALAAAAAFLVPAASAEDPPFGDVKLSAGLADELTRLEPDTVHGAFVHFSGGTPAEHRSLLGSYRLEITHDFESTASAVYAIGAVADLRALTHESVAISYMEED